MAALEPIGDARRTCLLSLGIRSHASCFGLIVRQLRKRYTRALNR